MPALPLTAPSLANTTLIVDGRDTAGDAVHVANWAAVARSGGTVVVQNPASVVDQIVAEFIAAGLPSEMPVAIVRRPGTPSQRTRVTTIGSLVGELGAGGARRPATLVIGWAVVLRDELGWFEERPLFGKRLVVASARHAPGELQTRLRELGATVIEPPAGAMARLDLEPLRELVERPDITEWLVFDGVEVVDIFWEALLASGAGRARACRPPHRVRGRRYGCGAARSWDHGGRCTRGLYARGTRRVDWPSGRTFRVRSWRICRTTTPPTSRASSRTAGAVVTEFPLYRIVVPERARDAFRRSIERRPPDAILVLSPDGAERWRDAAGEELASCAPIVARGESAAATLRVAGDRAFADVRGRRSGCIRDGATRLAAETSMRWSSAAG